MKFLLVSLFVLSSVSAFAKADSCADNYSADCFRRATDEAKLKLTKKVSDFCNAAVSKEIEEGVEARIEALKCVSDIFKTLAKAENDDLQILRNAGSKL